jgi:hypothetical protein
MERRPKAVWGEDGLGKMMEAGKRQGAGRGLRRRRDCVDFAALLDRFWMVGREESSTSCEGCSDFVKEWIGAGPNIQKETKPCDPVRGGLNRLESSESDGRKGSFKDLADDAFGGF